jgi:lysophospholipase L1-like esterase
MKLSRVALLSPLLLAPCAIPQSRTWTILCLGDSITACSGNFGCYRVALAELLAKNGIPVRFVGTQESDSPLGKLRHEGYGGHTAEFLAENIERLYTANPADIILLHAGHNHFAEEHPVPGIIRATEQIIATARRINPRVIVMLAEVIPSGKLPKYSYLPDLNRELSRLANRLDRPCQPVILVDQASRFDPIRDTVEDLVHPNQQGAEKIARQWYTALTAEIAKPRPICPQ